MTAPAIAPAPSAPATPAAPVAPVAPAPITSDPVLAAVEQLTPKKPDQQAPESESFSDRIARVGRKVSEHGKEFIERARETETHPAQQGDLTPSVDLGGIAPAGDAIPAPGTAPATPPALVPAIEAEDADGSMSLRARDPKSGQFSEMDQSRLYELSIKDKQTGETRVYQKSLPDLMRMAKQGLHFGEVQNELQYYRSNSPKWQDQHKQITGTLQQATDRAGRLEALALELLTADEDTVVQRRSEYAKQFTPESENARLRAQLAQLQNRGQQPAPQTPPPAQQVQQQQATLAFVQRTASVMANVEQMVGKEAAVGQMALFTLPLLVNGQLPPHRLGELEAYIMGPYRQWAESVSSQRTSTDQQKSQELAAARAIQQKAQQQANTIGAATRPLGGTSSTAPVQGPPPKNREELIQRIAKGRPQNQMAG